MRATTQEPSQPTTSPHRDEAPSRLDPQAARQVCPFLRSVDAAWTSTYASRDLRCWAVQPAAQLAAQRQRQLCVTTAHETCATYAAAASDPHSSPADGEATALWPDASTVPVALDAVHSRPGMNVSSPRTGGQAVLVGLMVVAFLVLVIARANPLAAPGASPTPGASAGADGSALVGGPAALSPSPVPSVADTPSPAQPSPTAAATPSTAPSATARTYKVRAGDTIASIAAKYHTTVTAIVKANHIVDPRTIHPGQVLIIP